jgi:hypothetical protein
MHVVGALGLGGGAAPAAVTAPSPTTESVAAGGTPAGKTFSAFTDPDSRIASYSATTTNSVGSATWTGTGLGAYTIGSSADGDSGTLALTALDSSGDPLATAYHSWDIAAAAASPDVHWTRPDWLPIHGRDALWTRGPHVTTRRGSTGRDDQRWAYFGRSAPVRPGRVWATVPGSIRRGTPPGPGCSLVQTCPATSTRPPSPTGANMTRGQRRGSGGTARAQRGARRTCGDCRTAAANFLPASPGPPRPNRRRRGSEQQRASYCGSRSTHLQVSRRDHAQLAVVERRILRAVGHGIQPAPATQPLGCGWPRTYAYGQNPIAGVPRRSGAVARSQSTLGSR